MPLAREMDRRKPVSHLTAIKLTLNLSRSSVAALDRIRAKRLERGASRREVQPSRLIEEAVELLKKKEGI